MIHHDAITGTHSLTAKRDYEERINEAEALLADTNAKLFEEYDLLFKRTYGLTKLESLARLILQSDSQVEINLVKVFNP